MFFSVKSSVKIAGKVYTPCVCYPVTDFLKATVDNMAKEDKAFLYEYRVFFQNGKVIEKKAEEPKPAETKKTKKVKKEEIKEEEEIPSPQEIADDMTAGDF